MSELGEFLTAYARSYETYDPMEVAKFIHCPCTFFLRDDCVLLDTRLKINEFMQTGLKAYRASDCIRFKARLLDERRIGPRFAVIDVEWSPENSDGEQIMLFSTTYTDISQITPDFRQIVPPFHRQGNRIPSAAIRWPNF